MNFYSHAEQIFILAARCKYNYDLELSLLCHYAVAGINSQIRVGAIRLSKLLSCAGDLSSDFGHWWHVSQKSDVFDKYLAYGLLLKRMLSFPAHTKQMVIRDQNCQTRLIFGLHATNDQNRQRLPAHDSNLLKQMVTNDFC